MTVCARDGDYRRKSFLHIAAKIVALIAETPRIQARTLAEGVGVPSRYMEPALQKLVRSGVLRGIRGPNGGYEVARPLHSITLLDIESAIGTRKSEPFLGSTWTALDGVLARLEQQRLDGLRSVTLASLFAPQHPAVARAA